MLRDIGNVGFSREAGSSMFPVDRDAKVDSGDDILNGDILGRGCFRPVFLI